MQLLLNQQPDTGNFCYMYTRTMEMAIVGFVAITGGVILLAYTLFHMLETKKVNMISRTLIYIYACIIAQSLFYQSKWSISQAMYFSYRSSQETDNKYIQLAQLSKYVLLSEVLQIFTIQTMLILVFYNWIDKIIDLMQNLSEFQVGNCKKVNKYMRFQIICRKVTLMYLMFRFIPYGLIIFYSVSKSNDGSPSGLLFKLSFLFMLIQAFFIPIILGLGIFAIKHSTKVIQIIDSSQIKTLINQYIVLIICTIFRFCMGLFDVYLQVYDNHFNKRCVLQDIDVKNNIVFKLMMLISSDIIMYYIPVIIVLRIFQVSKQNQLTDSLIQSLKHESIYEEVTYT